LSHGATLAGAFEHCEVKLAILSVVRYLTGDFQHCDMQLVILNLVRCLPGVLAHVAVFYSLGLVAILNYPLFEPIPMLTDALEHIALVSWRF